MIFEIKSPFNLRLEPEFSTGSPVGDPGGARLGQRRLAFCAIPPGVGDPGGTRTHDTRLKRPVL